MSLNTYIFVHDVGADKVAKGLWKYGNWNICCDTMGISQNISRQMAEPGPCLELSAREIVVPSCRLFLMLLSRCLLAAFFFYTLYRAVYGVMNLGICQCTSLLRRVGNVYVLAGKPFWVGEDDRYEIHGSGFTMH